MFQNVFSLGCFETFFSKQTNSVSTSIKQTTDCTKVITQVIYHSLSDKLRKVDRNWTRLESPVATNVSYNWPPAIDIVSKALTS